MLEYMAYIKLRKNREQKQDGRAKVQHTKDEATRAVSGPPAAIPLSLPPMLTKDDGDDDDDKFFFGRLLTSRDAFSDEDGKRPPLPPRLKTPDLSWDSDSDGPLRNAQSEVSEKDKDELSNSNVDAEKKATLFSFFARKSAGTADLKPTDLAVPEAEEEREREEITRVLDDLNLSAHNNNKRFSLSKESADLVAKFTLVLKDLVNGVPTAANDLRALLEDHDGTLAKMYEKLPGSLKKMVTTLPSKLTGSLAPDLLAAAAESQGLRGDNAPPKGTVKEQAAKLATPKNLAELVAKPSAMLSMLKAIINALKVRWPAFIGTNVVWSIALFLLLFVLWYCYKRGREVRLERERSAAATTEADNRAEETNPL